MRKCLGLTMMLALLIASLTGAQQGPVTNDKDMPRASGLLRQELSRMAQGVKDFLRDRNVESIAVGSFSGPPRLPSGAGAGLVRVLSEELQRLGIKVSREAKLGLSGSYRLIEKAGNESDAGGAAVAGAGKKVLGVVKAQVEDNTGKTLVDFEQNTSEPGALAALFGLTFGPPGRGNNFWRNPGEEENAIHDSFFKPKVDIEDTQVHPVGSNTYALEILIKGKGGKYRPRRATIEEGLAFVPIQRGEVYAVRLINNSTQESSVELTIDGLNSFAFSKNKKSKRWLVSPGKSTTINGWHRNNEELNEFVITEYAKGAVSLLDADPANVGTITATFRPAWEERAMMAGAATLGSAMPKSAKSDSTGLGQKVKQKSQTAKRQVGNVVAAVSIRYQK